MKKFQPRTFIKLFLLVFLALIASTIIFNLIIDPFELHNVIVIEKLNKKKSELSDKGRLYQAIQIVDKKPQAIILGSSRAKLGIDPADLSNILNGIKTCNVAFEGATFDEIYEYFLHALHNQPNLKCVVIGLDVFAFNKKLDFRSGFSKQRLQIDNRWHSDIFDSLATYNALSASIKTVKNNYLNLPSSNPILAFGEVNWLKQIFRSQEWYSDYKICDKKIQKFSNLVRICQDKHIDLKVFFNPCKAIYWEFFHHFDMWPVVVELKERLSDIYPIWDFSGFNLITTEALKIEGPPLYIDCSHYSPQVGKYLLNIMFKEGNKSNEVYLLTPSSRNSVNDNILEAREKWVEKNQQFVRKRL
ncbi:MAG: hypothetical protein H0W88_03880 [Parachlamydiaceae bacterium]|nr:hypothetical protein [Parachlamydiaceae bacterium]